MNVSVQSAPVQQGVVVIHPGIGAFVQSWDVETVAAAAAEVYAAYYIPFSNPNPDPETGLTWHQMVNHPATNVVDLINNVLSSRGATVALSPNQDVCYCSESAGVCSVCQHQQQYEFALDDLFQHIIYGMQGYNPTLAEFFHYVYTHQCRYTASLLDANTFAISI